VIRPVPGTGLAVLGDRNRQPHHGLEVAGLCSCGDEPVSSCASDASEPPPHAASVSMTTTKKLARSLFIRLFMALLVGVDLGIATD